MGNTIGPQVWTPGSDYTLAASDGQMTFTRDGNDTIITYDPAADNEDRRKLDVWNSDREVPILDARDPDPLRDWQN